MLSSHQFLISYVPWAVSDVQTETAFREFYKAASDLLDEWVQFYRTSTTPACPPV